MTTNRRRFLGRSAGHNNGKTYVIGPVLIDLVLTQRPGCEDTYSIELDGRHQCGGPARLLDEDGLPRVRFLTFMAEVVEGDGCGICAALRAELQRSGGGVATHTNPDHRVEIPLVDVEPCPGGPHTYDEHENSLCSGPSLPSPCPSFVSQGFGPEGDYEHSLYCSVCGWEYAEHVGDECPECSSTETVANYDGHGMSECQTCGYQFLPGAESIERGDLP